MRTIVAAAAAIATGLAAGAAVAGKADDTLNAAFLAEPEAMDHYKIAGREGLIIARHIYDGLLEKDVVSNTVKPALATAWTFIDPLTIELQLREGVTFHDGSAFDADDVVYTLETVKDAAYGARYRFTVDWIDRVEKIDAYKVRLHMARPNAVAAEMLGNMLPIYPSDYFKAVGSQGMAAKPVGTGPYRLVEMSPGTRYVMERFDGHYAGSPKGKPAIKRVVVRAMPEGSTQYAELLTGRLDWIWRVPPDQAKRLATQPAVQIVNGSIMRIGYVQFNVRGKGKTFATADKRVREAILHAVDREKIMGAFVGGASKVQHAACNPAQFGCFQDVKRYAYDPARARALLAEAGHAGGLDLELLFSAMPRPQAEAMASDLGKVGIRAALNEQQYAAAAQRWRAGEAPFMLANWGSYGIADVSFILDQFFAGGGDDMLGDAQMQGWLKEATTTNDPKVREDRYRKALQKIADEAWWMSLWDFNVNYGLSKDLAFRPDPDEYARWWQAKWK
ncbi:MAG: ABC transporter substrate-binding protein [Alphaproteobacteria bacterium]|nr:ABC transporter substrate-binding protein [Alphaproteobacteria bacterium]